AGHGRTARFVLDVAARWRAAGVPRSRGSLERTIAATAPRPPTSGATPRRQGHGGVLHLTHLRAPLPVVLRGRDTRAVYRDHHPAPACRMRQHAAALPGARAAIPRRALPPLAIAPRRARASRLIPVAPRRQSGHNSPHAGAP